MKKDQSIPQSPQILDLLTRLSKRIEEATVDIHSIKSDMKAMKWDIKGIESDTSIMKVDVERMKSEMQDMKVDIQGIKGEMEGFETRLNKRITYIADLITIQLGGKVQKHEKRIAKLERAQQLS